MSRPKLPAGHPDNTHTRLTAARNPQSSKKKLTELASDPSSHVRMSAARNPNTPPDALATLANDPDWRVRYYIAAARHTPTATLAQLADDPNHEVRFAADMTRKLILRNHIKTLTGDARQQGKLLAPTFTGWPEDLDQLLAHLNTPNPGPRTIAIRSGKNRGPHVDGPRR